ncbi:CAP domain-containing protein [Microdochium trichocladiopsis]|uniref:CAP domain-containing protein n=1 Tax=Microdochium trichocladiopsis TaxID=1682393 RepID=A0A9P8XVZ3_9PEZI|nr:CAP domain-containing protein [Microdochium trichocladiopsis]KAH7021571.1 CAP domain-containing protein [Microdochium trichocladiopsis]
MVPHSGSQEQCGSAETIRPRGLDTSVSQEHLDHDLVSTITVAPTIPSEAPQFVSRDLFTSAILNSTNFFRKEHSAPPTYAETWLKGNTACEFEHSGGPYGENLALGCSDAQSCVDAWGNERSMYPFDKPGFYMDTGDFTQLVWKNTTTVGCGKKLCEQGWFLACEYWPRGNFAGAYADQVARQPGAASGLRPSVVAVLSGVVVLGLWLS